MTTRASPGHRNHTRLSGPSRWPGSGSRRVWPLRRSRWFWLVWILALWVTIPATVSRYAELVPDTEVGRLTTAALAANPTMRAMLGPPFELLNAGGFVMWRVGTFVAAAAGVMAALGVIRATRAEEEEGRTELLRSGIVGRHTPLGGWRHRRARGLPDPRPAHHGEPGPLRAASGRRPCRRPRHWPHRGDLRRRRGGRRAAHRVGEVGARHCHGGPRRGLPGAGAGRRRRGQLAAARPAVGLTAGVGGPGPAVCR